MASRYVHGHGSLEHQRLHDQAGALVDLLHADTSYPDGSRVLEPGCGVGAQTVTLARRSPGATIVAFDVDEKSLRAARRAVVAASLPNVNFERADIHHLPFAARSFDHVFVCFMLEHLADPLQALVRLRTLLRPGGSLTVIEGDHGSTYFHPESAAARAAIACQVRLQQESGGNSLIGRQVYPLLTAAGLRDVRVSPRMVYVDGTRPDLAGSFTLDTFTAMIRGVRQSAVAAGLTTAGYFDKGIRDLRRTARRDGVFCYTFFKGVGLASPRRQKKSQPD